jgi:hypothetical protein
MVLFMKTYAKLFFVFLLVTITFSGFLPISAAQDWEWHVSVGDSQTFIVTTCIFLNQPTYNWSDAFGVDPSNYVIITEGTELKIVLTKVEEGSRAEYEEYINGTLSQISGFFFDFFIEFVVAGIFSAPDDYSSIYPIIGPTIDNATYWETYMGSFMYNSSIVDNFFTVSIFKTISTVSGGLDWFFYETRRDISTGWLTYCHVAQYNDTYTMYDFEVIHDLSTPKDPIPGFELEVFLLSFTLIFFISRKRRP